MSTTIDTRYVILWFPPDGDKRKAFTDEGRAREFAANNEVANWHPLMERLTVTTITETELIPLDPEQDPRP